MTKIEFLDELKNCLSGEVTSQEMMESCSYYSTYIEDKIRQGMSEEDVIAELGMPNLLAKSIIAASGKERTADYEYTEDGRTRKARPEHEHRNRDKSKKEKKEFHFDFSSWYAKVLLVIILILIIVLLFFIVNIGLGLFIAFGVPIAIILGIVYLIMYFVGKSNNTK